MYLGKTSGRRNFPDVFGQKYYLNVNMLLSCLTSAPKPLIAGEVEVLGTGRCLQIYMCVCVCCGEQCGSWLGRVSHCFLLYKSSYSVPHVKYFFQMWPYKSKALWPCGADRLVSGSCAPCCTRRYLGFVPLRGRCCKATGGV